jgi:hypothetical protein
MVWNGLGRDKFHTKDAKVAKKTGSSTTDFADGAEFTDEEAAGVRRQND